MGRWEKESFVGVIVQSKDPGEEEGKVLCADCFENEDKKHKILEVLTREVTDDELFVCDECGWQI